MESVMPTKRTIKAGIEAPKNIAAVQAKKNKHLSPMVEYYFNLVI